MYLNIKEINIIQTNITEVMIIFNNKKLYIHVNIASECLLEYKLHIIVTWVKKMSQYPLSTKLLKYVYELFNSSSSLW